MGAVKCNKAPVMIPREFSVLRWVCVEKLHLCSRLPSPCLRFAYLMDTRVWALTHLHMSVCVFAHWTQSHALVCSCTCTPTCVCVSLTGCAFCHVCSLSLPGPGVPIRTPRHLCACLPKTTASPGPPRGRGQPNVTWTLYRVMRGRQEEASRGRWRWGIKRVKRH